MKPFDNQRLSCRGGFTLIELVVVLLMLVVGGVGIYFYNQQQTMARQCARNLHRLYMAAEMYEMERGVLPRLAFFPEDPKQDANSLAVVLGPYGALPEVCVCPAAPVDIRAMGLTYVWNVRVNGRPLHGLSGPEWLVTEINAISRDYPAAHLGRYNILYTDGQVRRLVNPPSGL